MPYGYFAAAECIDQSNAYILLANAAQACTMHQAVEIAAGMYL
jgi:hypothetical protein